MGNRNGHTDIVNKLMATKGEREGDTDLLGGWN